ncbi:MAG: hypothetical protein EOP00_33840 [Pedobacter sp.]|nr:MAG: hypothetical protein EOP00_33840 [Pedobacter sp.]
MENIDLLIIPTNLLYAYKESFDIASKQNFEQLQDSELSISTFSFYTSVSVVFSSKIEGEPIEIDSYIKHKRFGAHFKPDYTQKIDDLYDAYLFAQQNQINKKNLLSAHAQLTKHILIPSQQGKFRTGNMFVVTASGKIEYVAALPNQVTDEMQKLFTDIETLLNVHMAFAEVLYFASMLHLVLAKIHPFEDGNGRISRLLEKWFISQKLGAKAWFISSEKNYYEQHQNYYQNLRCLGLEYEELDYNQALPFLKMLPQSLKTDTVD